MTSQHTYFSLYDVAFRTLRLCLVEIGTHVGRLYEALVLRFICTIQVLLIRAQ